MQGTALRDPDWRFGRRKAAMSSSRYPIAEYDRPQAAALVCCLLTIRDAMTPIGLLRESLAVLRTSSRFLSVYRARFFGHKFAGLSRSFPDAFFEA